MSADRSERLALLQVGTEGPGALGESSAPGLDYSPSRAEVEAWRARAPEPAARPARAPLARPVRGAGSVAARPAWRALKRCLAHAGTLVSVPTRALLVGVLLYVCIFNFSVVRGSSMAPGIHDGDRIVIDQVGYWVTGLRRGDVVVLRYPGDPRVEYIKRVVGLPGDEVVLAGGLVWVNGHLLDEPYVAHFDSSSWARELVLPEHVFVLGDNRPHSSDSREFGQVPLENLRGRVELRIWPPERLGWIE